MISIADLVIVGSILVSSGKSLISYDQLIILIIKVSCLWWTDADVADVVLLLQGETQEKR